VAILLVFLTKGVAIRGNYLINVVGYSVVTDLRQRTFDKVIARARILPAAFHRQADVVDMSDIDRIQLPSRRCSPTGSPVVFRAGASVRALQQRLETGAVSATVLPFVLLPTYAWTAHPKHDSQAQDNAAELNQIMQEGFSGHGVVKTFGAESSRVPNFTSQRRGSNAIICATPRCRRCPRRLSSFSAQ